MNDRQKWRTPPKIFDKLNKVFKFTVDACADESNHLLPIYWTEQQNCIKQDWTEHKAFVNPPFKNAKNIIRKAREADQAVFLLPESCLTTRYFADNPPDYIGIPPSRIRFEPPNSIVTSSSPDRGTVALLYNATETQIDEFRQETGWLVCKILKADSHQPPSEVTSNG